MVTAIMIGPDGKQLQPRYERTIFDTLDDCQTALRIEEFYASMYITLMYAYPKHTLQTIGCGAWNMTNFGDPEAETQPLTYY